MARRRTGDADPRVVGAIAGVIVVLVALVAVALLTGQDAPVDEVGIDGLLTATPMATATDLDAPSTAAEAIPPEPAGPAPSAGGSPGGDPSSGSAPVPEPAAEPTGPRAPTDADAADFAARLDAGSGAEVVLADTDADGTSEVVVASVLGGRVRIDVAGWTGTSYQLAFSGEGGTAEAVEDVAIRDLNGTPESLEIAVTHTSGAEGRSASLWGLREGRFTELVAVDGCWNGSNTYGIVGVRIDPPEIIATCDGSPDPVVSWSSDVYRWDPELDAFAYERTVE